jgi:type IX secretion system PorP/SprF family membrane protein
MNKLKLVIVLLIGFLSSVKAQQKPYYTQYILNNYILNPALSGIENYTDVKLSYRNQWSGIDGAPVTMYFSVQGPINKTDTRTTATSYQIPGTNPRGEAYWEDYTAPQPHSGIGLIAINDVTGYINRTSVYGTYAYHAPLSAHTTLALGFQAGFTNVSLDRTKINFAQTDPNDPAVGYNNGELKKLTPELGAGLWLYSRDYFIGTSVLNIVPGKANFSQTDTYGNVFSPQYFVTGGYRALIGGDMSILPSMLIQMGGSEPISVHTNVKVQYMDLVWFGGSYRFSDELGGFAAMAGVNISNTFNIGYSYDLSTTSRLQTYTRGTNEIVIGFLINNKYGDTCPRNVW